MIENDDSLGEREIEQAEEEIIGIALRHPTSWPKIQHVRSEWFREWSDQQLWQAIQRCYEINDGLVEAIVLADVLQELFDDDASVLAERALQLGNGYLHAEFIDFHLAILERHGQRLALKRWGMVVVEMCDSRPMADIRRILSQMPEVCS